jgi:hypothetical protein
MKDAGTAHWNNPNVGATNSSGFGLPEGIVTSLVHSTALATTVTGGVLRQYFRRLVPRPGSQITAM